MGCYELVSPRGGGASGAGGRAGHCARYGVPNSRWALPGVRTPGGKSCKRRGRLRAEARAMHRHTSTIGSSLGSPSTPRLKRSRSSKAEVMSEPIVVPKASSRATCGAKMGAAEKHLERKSPAHGAAKPSTEGE
eukprot:scaffold151671_cov37-Tisochrysis_lutea.AAC.1